MMRIHVASSTIFIDEAAAYPHYCLMTGKDTPIEGVDWLAEGYPEYRQPVVSAAQKLGQTPVRVGDYWTHEVVPETAEELSFERAQAVEQIKQAGKAYLYDQIDADGIALVERLVAAGHLYGIDNSQWCIDLRKDQYLRMAQVEAGVVDFSPALLDFSNHGDKPYTVVQMMMAAGL